MNRKVKMSTHLVTRFLLNEIKALKNKEIISIRVKNVRKVLQAEDIKILDNEIYILNKNQAHNVTFLFKSETIESVFKISDDNMQKVKIKSIKNLSTGGTLEIMYS